MAILFRMNAQSEAYEAALAEIGVPYVVQGAERFFERPEIRQAIVALRSAERSTPADTPLVAAVVAALEAVGWRPGQPPAGGAARERWEALAALLGLAEEFDGGRRAPEPPDERPGGRTLADFGVELGRRAAAQHAPAIDGVTLASLHSAKGLEWDAVFLVGLAEGTLPTVYAKTPEALEEERRLLYVGVTRAREWLWMSYAGARSAGGRQRRPSRFLPGPDPAETPRRIGAPKPIRTGGAVARRSISCRICGAALLGGAERKLGRCASCPSDLDDELLERLLDWRGRVASAMKVPAYVVFTDATMSALAERRPPGQEALMEIAGIGARKLGMYGDAVLALVAGATVDSVMHVDVPE